MRKLLVFLSAAIAVSTLSGVAPFSIAQAAKPSIPSVNHVETANGNVQDVAAVQALLKDLLAASNQHNLDAVLKHYSPNFTSGDGLSLSDVRGLIKDTWQMFPDIRYDSQVVEIRLNGNWGTVESIDTATASAKVDPTISDKPGTMKSRSRGILFLHRLGKTWDIVSDSTLYEKAIISYGPFENVDVDLEAPEQVFAGDSYTAKMAVGVPAGNIAFATITQEPLTYPQQSPKDKFRTLSSDKTELERIFKANATNNNEVVTATIGFTEIGQDDQERPTINLKGILTVVKRVNVIPKSTYLKQSSDAQVVHATADGKTNLAPNAQTATPREDDSDEPMDIEPGSSSD